MTKNSILFGLMMAVGLLVSAPSASRATVNDHRGEIEGDWIDESSGSIEGLVDNVIYQGTKVAPSEMVAKSTFTVELFAPEEPDFHFPSCTGTLIAKDVILTAGHCLPRRQGVQMVVKAGASGKRLRAVQIIRHPRFSELNILRNDVALLRFEKAIPGGVPALLPKTDLTIGVDQKVLVAGVGENGLEMSARPPKTDLDPEELVVKTMNVLSARPLLRTESLVQMIKSDGGSPTMVLTSGRSICHGDSGGPSYLCQKSGRLVVVGIHTSGTNDKCEQRKDGWFRKHQEYGYDTYVPTYVDWIRETLRDMTGTDI